MNKLSKQPCPMCRKNTLTLIEDEKNIPHFGKCYILSMNCSNCKYNKSDIDPAEKKNPVKYTFEIENEKDLHVRVVKSSDATVKVPRFKLSMTPGPASIGFISNIEGLLHRFKKIIEKQRDFEDDPEINKKAKKLLKKLWKVECGDEKLKIIIEDPSGNSAIISDKAKVEKLK